MLSTTKDLLNTLSIAFFILAGIALAIYTYLKNKNEDNLVTAKERGRYTRHRYNSQYSEQPDIFNKNPTYLEIDEQILYHIHDETTNISVTQNRLIVSRNQDLTQNHFDVDEIAHISFTHFEESKYKIPGIIIIIMGIITISLTTRYIDDTVSIGLGLLLIITGIALYFYTDKESTMNITLRGIETNHTFKIKTDAHETQQLIKKVFNTKKTPKNPQLDSPQHILNPEIT